MSACVKYVPIKVNEKPTMCFGFFLFNYYFDFSDHKIQSLMHAITVTKDIFAS